MSELPDSWTILPIGEVNQFTGSTLNPATRPDEVFELYSVPSFPTGNPERLRGSAIGSTKQTVAPGDVLISKINPRINRVWTVGPKGSEVQIASSEWIGFRSGAVQPAFANYYFKSPDFREILCSEVAGVGGSLTRAQPKRVTEYPIPIAPAAEQTRIANQLDTLLTRIQSCNDRFDAIPALLKRFRQAVLDAATTGELTEDWRQDNVGDVAPENVMAARLAVAGPRLTKAASEFFTNHQPAKLLNGELPDSWLLTHVGMVGVVSNGSTPSRKEPSYWGGEIPWVSSGEVANGVIRRTREQITEKGFNNSSVRLLPKGTVLMAMIGEGKTRGQSAILDIAACINQNIAGVVPVAGVLDSKYLWFWFRREYENTRQKGNGSGPKALNCERVRELEINLPPLTEQIEIVRRVEALFAVADRIEARATAARAQAQRLGSLVLSKAFRGELTPQDPNDEPATELLLRLTASRTESANRVRKAKNIAT